MRLSFCMKIIFVLDYHCLNLLEIAVSSNFYCGIAKKNLNCLSCHKCDSGK